MDDVILRYFRKELRYLDKEGERFAKVHPSEGLRLNITGHREARNPDVERLLEGFAFLTGRIHERLEDELPQYTEALFDLLWPHYLRPIPAMSIVEFRPERHRVPATTPYKRGTEVFSGRVGEERDTCRFRTTQDVYVQPMALGAVEYETDRVRFRFELDRNIEYESLWRFQDDDEKIPEAFRGREVPLRLYFRADEAVAATMLLYLSERVQEVMLYAGEEYFNLGRQARFRKKGPQACLQPLWRKGLTGEETVSLLPERIKTFSGFRLLQEYLCFRRRFWFVDLVGLGAFTVPEQTRTFDVEVCFSQPYPRDAQCKIEDVRLHCTPVVNLFSIETEPIREKHLSSEHRIIPGKQYECSREVYELEKVQGRDAAGRLHEYAPFYRFGHAERSDGVRYFTTTRRVIRTEICRSKERYDVYLSLVGDGHAAIKSLFVDALCTNGNLPNEELNRGGINQLQGGVPQFVHIENLSRPTEILYPPTQEPRDFLWRLISHMSLNYLSVADRQSLAALFALYDWTKDEVNRKRLGGLQEVTWQAKDHFVDRGAVIRGAEVTLTLQDTFPSEGALRLFGDVLGVFFSMYATLNSRVSLNIVDPSGLRFLYQGKSRPGKGPLL